MIPPIAAVSVAADSHMGGQDALQTAGETPALQAGS